MVDQPGARKSWLVICLLALPPSLLCGRRCGCFRRRHRLNLRLAHAARPALPRSGVRPRSRPRIGLSSSPRRSQHAERVELDLERHVVLIGAGSSIETVCDLAKRAGRSPARRPFACTVERGKVASPNARTSRFRPSNPCRIAAVSAMARSWGSFGRRLGTAAPNRQAAPLTGRARDRVRSRS